MLCEEAIRIRLTLFLSAKSLFIYIYIYLNHLTFKIIKSKLTVRYMETNTLALQCDRPVQHHGKGNRVAMVTRALHLTEISRQKSQCYLKYTGMGRTYLNGPLSTSTIKYNGQHTKTVAHAQLLPTQQIKKKKEKSARSFPVF